jgi:hypothetical protein
MSHSSAGDTPGDLDVIIRCTKDRSSRCTLGTPLEPQLACRTYGDALDRAFRFARSHDVGVWQTEDDRSFEKVPEPQAGTSTGKGFRARTPISE